MVKWKKIEREWKYEQPSFWTHFGHDTYTEPRYTEFRKSLCRDCKVWWNVRRTDKRFIFLPIYAWLHNEGHPNYFVRLRYEFESWLRGL